MFSTYDRYAKLHAVLRAFSGGPLYITDRDPEKTDLGLVKRLVLPGGRVLKVDRPAVPTSDALFKNPYTDGKLLKLISTCGGVPVLGLFNIDREGRSIRDSFTPKDLPKGLWNGDAFLYFMVFKGKGGISEGGLFIELSEADREVVVVFPLARVGKAFPVGLAEYLLPSCTIEPLAPGAGSFRALAKGTLVVLGRDGSISKRWVEPGMVFVP